MSILNRPSDGSAPVLLVLWRALRILGPLPKDRLLSLCAPESIGDDTARKTLTRWTQLGLFVGEDDAIRLASPFDALEATADREYRCFRGEVRRLVLSEPSNHDFSKAEPGGAADFTFVATWLLSTDINADHFRSHQDIQRFERDQVEPMIGKRDDDKYALQNDTRWSGFRDWAAFLGFGWNITPFYLDPTDAISDELGSVFETQRELTAETFIRQLGRRVPVLDGGQYYLRARDRAAKGWRPIKDHEVSPALTRALLRLEEAGHIVLEARSDADSRQMLGGGFSNIRSVSHISLPNSSQ